MAANGRTAAECYALGLDPTDATNDFRIVSIEMVVKGADRLEGPWAEVPEDGGSPGTARPTMRFFKVVVELP